LSDKLQETATRCVVVPVLSEVIREFVDSCREDSHLDLDRPFVGIVSLVFLDYRRFCRLVQSGGSLLEITQFEYRKARLKNTPLVAWTFTGSSHRDSA
jgi:hypothetical protein